MIKKGWKKQLYIATKLSTIPNEYGHDDVVYSTPKRYMFNYQPASGALDIELYGERIIKIYKAVIPFRLYVDKFNVGDVAYLDNVTPLNEPKNGYNANYVITNVMQQNKAIVIYFEKITK